MVVLQHPGDLLTVYAHSSLLMVTQGQPVRAATASRGSGRAAAPRHPTCTSRSAPARFPAIRCASFPTSPRARHDGHRRARHPARAVADTRPRRAGLPQAGDPVSRSDAAHGRRRGAAARLSPCSPNASRRHRPELVIAIESRGFIFGAAVAASLGIGFVPVRKPGKLPHKTRRRSYALEYGTDALEMHEDAFVAGARVVIVDDLLATGGTAAATIELVRGLGGHVVGAPFVVELALLRGANASPASLSTRCWITELGNPDGFPNPPATGAAGQSPSAPTQSGLTCAGATRRARRARFTSATRARRCSPGWTPQPGRRVRDARRGSGPRPYPGRRRDAGPGRSRLAGDRLGRRPGPRRRVCPLPPERAHARLRRRRRPPAAAGRAFPCACSRADVARAASAPHAADEDGPRYPGTCRALDPDSVRARSARRGGRP